MPLNEVLRQKRRELGLTQEDVANALCVTPPAVNKWEKGATCPDIALLPALARLLRTDLNTLLCFREDLTDREIGEFLRIVADRAKGGDLAGAFALAEDKIREYPACAKLCLQAALALDGAVLLAGLPAEERETWRGRAEAFYEQAASLDDADSAAQANFMLASARLARGALAAARQAVSRLPAPQAQDRRELEAELLLRENKPDEAARMLAGKAFSAAQGLLATLSRLARCLIAREDGDGAARVAECARQMCLAMGLGRQCAWAVPLEVALARKDAPGAMAALRATVEAACEPFDRSASPLLRCFSAGEKRASAPPDMLPAILRELRESPDYDFLRGDVQFAALLADLGRRAAGGGKGEEER